MGPLLGGGGEFVTWQAPPRLCGRPPPPLSQAGLLSLGRRGPRPSFRTVQGQGVSFRSKAITVSGFGPRVMLSIRKQAHVNTVCHQGQGLAPCPCGSEASGPLQASSPGVQNDSSSSLRVSAQAFPYRHLFFSCVCITFSFLFGEKKPLP